MTEMSNMSSDFTTSRIARGAPDPNSQISRKLRDFYDSVHEERIPDRFLDLLEKLDEAEQSTRPRVKSPDIRFMGEK